MSCIPPRHKPLTASITQCFSRTHTYLLYKQCSGTQANRRHRETAAHTAWDSLLRQGTQLNRPWTMNTLCSCPKGLLFSARTFKALNFQSSHRKPSKGQMRSFSNGSQCTSTLPGQGFYSRHGLQELEQIFSKGRGKGQRSSRSSVAEYTVG